MKQQELRRLPVLETSSLAELLDLSLTESQENTDVLTESSLVGSEPFCQGSQAYQQKLTLTECPYRPYSLAEAAWVLGYQDQYYQLEEIPDDMICEADEFYLKFGWIEETEQLTEAEYQGRSVPLNKPMRGGSKKFYVYVKDPKSGKIKKVSFGDPNLRIKKSDPKRRKSFVARHRCDTAKDKTTARYWSCRGATSRVGGKW
jgi:hypothetical protein